MGFVLGAIDFRWREGHRREANGSRFLLVVADSLAHLVSRQWKGCSETVII